MNRAAALVVDDHVRIDRLGSPLQPRRMVRFEDRRPVVIAGVGDRDRAVVGRRAEMVKEQRGARAAAGRRRIPEREVVQDTASPVVAVSEHGIGELAAVVGRVHHVGAAERGDLARVIQQPRQVARPEQPRHARGEVFRRTLAVRVPDEPHGQRGVEVADVRVVDARIRSHELRLVERAPDVAVGYPARKEASLRAIALIDMKRLPADQRQRRGRVFRRDATGADAAKFGAAGERGLRRRDVEAERRAVVGVREAH